MSPTLQARKPSPRDIMEPAQGQATRSSGAGVQTRAGWFQGPCSLPLDSELDYTILRQPWEINWITQEPRGP